MKKKIWDVDIGHNYSTKTVEAPNFIKAAYKALKLAAPVPRQEKWISRVEIIREIDS